MFVAFLGTLCPLPFVFSKLTNFRFSILHFKFGVWDPTFCEKRVSESFVISAETLFSKTSSFCFIRWDSDFYHQKSSIFLYFSLFCQKNIKKLRKYDRFSHLFRTLFQINHFSKIKFLLARRP